MLGMAAVPAVIGAALFLCVKQRLSPTLLGFLIFLVYGATFIGARLTDSVTAIWALLMVAGISTGLSIPYFTGTAVERASVEARPRAVSLIVGAMFAGLFFMPFLIGPIRPILGEAGVFAAMGGMFLAFGALLLLLGEHAPVVQGTAT
jgi:hypothetical protein